MFRPPRLPAGTADKSFAQETKIGHTVHKLRKHGNPGVAAAAKAAVQKWKCLAASSEPASPASPAAESQVALQSQVTETSATLVELHMSPGTAADALKQLARGRAAVCKALAKKLARAAGGKLATSACSQIKGGHSHDELALAAATAVEAALFQVLGMGDGNRLPKEYTDQFRRLHFNFGENEQLAAQVLQQQVDLLWLAEASAADVATDSFKRAAQAELIASSEEVMMDWQDKHGDEVREAAGIKCGPGFHRCGNCGSERTTFYQKQTRSADEPMTSFIQCKDCKHRWKD